LALPPQHRTEPAIGSVRPVPTDRRIVLAATVRRVTALAALATARFGLPALLAGCASTVPPTAQRAGGTPPDVGGTIAPGGGPSTVPRVTPSAAAEVAFLALSLVDTPYTFGGNTPRGGFDCSGLIVYAFRHAAGIELPRTVAQLTKVGTAVPERAARTGDLMFFHTTGPFSHAGIYVGESRFVHAPSTGGVVRVDGLSVRYWRSRLAEVRRI
jgi:cell wall-associated NlpC family hydrolase